MKTLTKIMLKGFTAILLALLTTLLLSFLLSGCLSVPQPSSPIDTTVAQPERHTTQPQAEQPSKLSYGAITSTVKKGTTTQAELVELFGGPNIATVDSKGIETWVYEKTSSETTTKSSQTAITQAERFDLFFGLGLFGTRKGSSQPTGSATVSHSIKTLTVIIKFDQKKTVKDFSARASYF